MEFLKANCYLNSYIKEIISKKNQMPKISNQILLKRFQDKKKQYIKRMFLRIDM